MIGLGCAISRQNFWIPAVKGTLNLLEAVDKAKSVKRVVLMSSIASMLVNKKPCNATTIVDESWWSDPEFCIERGTSFKSLTHCSIHLLHLTSTHVVLWSQVGADGECKQLYAVATRDPLLVRIVQKYAIGLCTIAVLGIPFVF